MTAYSVGPCFIDPSLNRLRRDGLTFQLEPKIAQVLLRLAEARGQVVNKEDLVRSVWTDTFVTDDVLTRSISVLRKVLGDDPRQPSFIETIPRVGYRLIAPISFPAEAAPEPGVSGLSGSAGSSGTRRTPSPPCLPSRNAGQSRGFIHRHPYSVAATAVSIAVLSAVLLFLLRSGRSQISAGRVMIAVLPFTNLSGDAGEEYFSDGMTEEVATDLRRLGASGLGVVAGPSVMHYEHSRQPIGQIGRELGVDYVLAGSVRRSGTRVRVAAQLVRIGDRARLWADTYDSELKDVLGLQARISESVAEALRAQSGAKPAPPGTVNAQAYQLYLKGRYFLDRSREQRLQNALASFQESVKLDPNFARSWAGMALSYELLEYVGMISPRESYPRAVSAATRAVQLDPDSAEGHLALAYVHEHYEWNWDGQDREVQHAMALEPGYELARRWSSYALLQRGELQPALEEMQRALSLDPLSPLVRINMATRLERVGRRDEAIRQLQEAVELDPRDPAPYLDLAGLYEKQQDFEKAGAALRLALEFDDKPGAVARFDRLKSQMGTSAAYTRVRREQLEAGLAELDRASASGQYTSPGRYAFACARLGDERKALYWLQRAYDEHASVMLELGDPIFDFLRHNPQFEELVSRVNMPGPPVQTASP